MIADGPIQTNEYYSVGKVTEFNAANTLPCLRGGDFNCLSNYGKVSPYSFSMANGQINFGLMVRCTQIMIKCTQRNFGLMVKCT